MAQRVISHHTVNGQIESQAYQGFTQAILTDALGSVVKTSSNDPNLRYTPYGSPLGASYWVQSLFTWVGSFGYRVTNAKYIESYVRARHYSAKSGAWTTADPLWPEERAYGYVNRNPTGSVDPYGHSAGFGATDPMKSCKNKRPRTSCFKCTYEYLHKKQNHSPQMSCDSANRHCGTHIACGPCGPGPAGFPNAPGCTDGLAKVMAFAHFLRGDSTVEDACGGFQGFDKLAHCYANCISLVCAGPIGHAACMWEQRGEDDPEDIEANEIGRGFGMEAWSGQECFDKCAKALYGATAF